MKNYSKHNDSARALWGVGLGFFALAAVLAAMPRRAELPIPKAAVVEAAQIKPGALRQVIGDPPTTMIGGFEQQCSECHKHFRNPIEAPQVMVQHTDLVFDHGLNDRCLNCHDRRDRDYLVGPGGVPLPFSQVVDLCARCHGTLYRDWQRGMHGKTMSSWDPKKQQRLLCTECHDPHAPAYRGFSPLPAPHTLRMGEQHGHDHEPSRTPLQHWNSHH